ncbi:MAG: methyltransferase domain-containing protein [Alphaproteobacteria bacterium]|jgi:NADH dehydrogenase [ubiquinone] 1 alpha subcomplex assembly factor 5
MTNTRDIFDRTLIRRRRDRASVEFHRYDFLFQEIATRLTDRLEDIQRTFPIALDLGCHAGAIANVLPRRSAVDWLAHSDISFRMAKCAASTALVADEEALPFADNAFDLVLSNLSLHWVNDLPGALTQIQHVLKPDGLFLATILGGDTLVEFRDCLLSAESEILGGASPRISPMVALGDAAGLLQRAGFALPVADSDTINVTYDNAFKLMADLRGMAEANAIRERTQRFTPRSVFMRAAKLYQDRYSGPEGRINTTFEVIYLHGWSPHDSQQKPLRPGSASQRLADALDTEEQPAGEKPV